MPEPSEIDSPFVTNPEVVASAPAGSSEPSAGDSPFVVKVRQVIEIIRPVIQADKGDIVLVDVDEPAGIVSVELIGACATCPASTQTLKAGVERIMKDRVPGVTEVLNVGDAKYEGTPLSL